MDDLEIFDMQYYDSLRLSEEHAKADDACRHAMMIWGYVQRMLEREIPAYKLEILGARIYAISFIFAEDGPRHAIIAMAMCHRLSNACTLFNMEVSADIWGTPSREAYYPEAVREAFELAHRFLMSRVEYFLKEEHNAR